MKAWEGLSIHASQGINLGMNVNVILTPLVTLRICINDAVAF